MSAVAFWGLTCESETNYSQAVEQAFRLTNIAIDSKTKATKGRVSVHVSTEDGEYVIANLLIGQVEQCLVDLTFNEGEEISFTVTGPATVHLTGNYIIDFDDEEEDDDEIDDEDDEELDTENEDSMISMGDSEDGDEGGMEIFFNDDGEPVDAKGNLIDLGDLLGNDEDDEDNEDEEDDDEDDEELDDEELEAEAEAQAKAEIMAELAKASQKKRKASSPVSKKQQKKNRK
ncbi:hypothetical protein HDU98_009989 [Podochytrium sp. JEL0797]|nr:hypothetical protein HDU98_009989 [Podochytrium sp. JEL0797]